MSHKLLLALGAPLLLMLSACHAPADHPETHLDSMTLKIYSVPTARSNTIAGALGLALGQKANVTSPEPGKLLVYAPQETQASISRALASLSQNGTTNPAAAQLNVHFWIVDGDSTQAADDPALKPLEPTFDALRKSMGPMHFRLIQAASSMSSSAQQASLIKTNQGTFQFQLEGTTPQSAALSLNYFANDTSGLQQLKTQIQAPFGHYIMLAQAPGVCPKPTETVISNGHAMTSPCADKPSLRLLITRVDRVAPSV